MRIREIMVTLLGSSMVYVAMAACSGSGDDPSKTARDNHEGEGGAATSGGQSGSGSHAEDDAGGMWDALTDPVPNASANPVSGSRLKAKFRRGADGSKVYLPFSWYDSQRQEDCTFALAGDGVERCLPSGSVFGLHFSDSACTKPIAPGAAGCTSKYALKYDTATGCSGTSAAHVHALGAKATVTTVYFQASGSCIATGAPSGYEYYEVGAEIQPTDFVEGIVQTDP